MSIADELLLPLMDGVHQDPPLNAFMRNLVARTQARRGVMRLNLNSGAENRQPVAVHAAAPRAIGEAQLDLGRIEALGLLRFDALRPNRIYALDDLLDHDRPDRPALQRAALDRMRIRYVRCLRVSAGAATSATLFIMRQREDFTAGAAATLTEIAAPLSAALRMLEALADQRTRTAMAESALERLGVGQVAFDAIGRVTAADAVAAATLSFTPASAPDRRLQLMPETTRMLGAICAGFATGRAGQHVLRLDDRAGLDLLLRPADFGPVAIGTLRMARREDAAGALPVLMTMYGMSEREAALAHALTMGETIADAGRRLGLTRETARNYSKRIYAKTGTSGQADLVRLILGSLVPFSG